MVHFYSRIAAFLFGVFLGILIAKIFVYREHERLNVPVKKQIPSYKTWSINQGFKRGPVSWDILRYNKSDIYHLESEFLFESIQVLCVIFIHNENNFDGAKNTWIPSCNKIQLIQIKSKNSKYIAVKRTKESSSWVRLCQCLINITEQYDWYLILYDNTFAILENLRFFVAPYNSSELHYFGHPVKFWNTVYNLGQAGYILSKGTLKAFKSSIGETECLSTIYWNREDFYLGKHLSKLNITPSDTRDSEGLSTFHPYNWYITFFADKGNNYYSTSIYPVKCCSKRAITFQAIEGSKMYTYYYLLYKLQIFQNGNLGNKKYQPQIADDAVWKKFLKERNVTKEHISSEEYYNLWQDLIEDPTSFAAQMKKEIHDDMNEN